MALGLNIAAHDVAYRFAFSPAVPMKGRWKLLQKLGWTGVRDSNIRDGCLFVGFDLEMQGCYLNRQVFIDASAPVKVGRGTQFGPRSMVITSTHDVGTHEQRGGTPRVAPVTIGAGCWIGAGAVILPGVTVADGCIVAAGAVVTRDTAPDGLYAGVPARRVKELD